MSYKRKDHGTRKRWRKQDWTIQFRDLTYNTRGLCEIRSADGREKYIYHTRAEAEERRRDQEEKAGRPLKIFRCKRCRGFHLTKKISTVDNMKK